MEGFRMVIKRRMVVTGIGLALAVAAFTGLMVWHVGMNHIAQARDTAFLQGFRTGLFGGMVAVAVIGMVKSALALRSDEKLRTLYVSENDERNRTIERLSAANTLTSALAALALSGLVASFYSFTVCMTLIAVAGAMAVIKVGLRVYYQKTV